MDTPKDKRKFAAFRLAYPNVKRKKIKNPKTGRMAFDTVANWKKKAAWGKQQVKQYIALRAMQRKIRGPVGSKTVQLPGQLIAARKHTHVHIRY